MSETGVGFVIKIEIFLKTTVILQVISVTMLCECHTNKYCIIVNQRTQLKFVIQ